jgi:IclR family KDG regulon transcriptional repressor
MKSRFKRVPAIDKCVEILELFAQLKKPLGVSEISRILHLNKSTVFNIVYTLDDLEMLEKTMDGKFQFGTRLYILGRTAGKTSALIGAFHPYLEEINQKTKLSAFLGMRSGLKAVIIDKADSAFDIKIHSEVGMRIPLLAGAGGRVLLAQLSDTEVDDILARNELTRYTPNSCVNKIEYKKLIEKARRDGFAVDMEEYIEGIRAFAMPVNANQTRTQIALWVVGLKRQITEANIPKTIEYLKAICQEIELRLI